MIRILLTNDDGLNAPGLVAMEQTLKAMPEVDLWVVAPDGERSACSHSMTLNRPLFATKHGPQRLALSGTPVDCVYFAMFGYLPKKPHVVISGINIGPNLGNDVIYSGTVAGAKEAVIRGVSGISVSQATGDNFEAVSKNAAKIALKTAQREGDPILLNLNYPGPVFKGPKPAKLGVRIYPELVEQRVAPVSKKKYYWLGGPPVQDRQIPGTDGHLIANGIASATILTLEQTCIKNTFAKVLSSLLKEKQ